MSKQPARKGQAQSSDPWRLVGWVAATGLVVGVLGLGWQVFCAAMTVPLVGMVIGFVEWLLGVDAAPVPPA